MNNSTRVTRQRRTTLTFVLAGALLFIALATGVWIGGQFTPATAVAAALRGEGERTVLAIVWEIRIPRSFAAIVAGFGLGLAASLLQTLTRNPVADAGLLGSNAGATVIVAAGMAAGIGSGVIARSALALFGALLATAFVCVVGLSGRVHSVTRLVLLGVALSAVLIGITNGIMLAVPEAFEGMRHWLAGSTVGVPLQATGIGALTVLGALLITALISRTLELSRLGDDSARALGAQLGITRAGTVLSIALASSAATALVGPIAFVGLLAAHAATRFSESLGLEAFSRHTLAAVGGAILLLCADMLGRVALWPGELPAGIVVAVIGAPVLLWIIRKARSLT